jgi:SAM-dependent methyltransferase
LVKFEEIGWQRISIEEEALNAVQQELRTHGIQVRDLDISTYAREFAEFVKQPCYAGEYRLYGGTADHCLLEKALEHFLSFKLINPRREMTGVDIGSCKSVAPLILRETPGCACYEQDLEYPPGIEGTRIGSSADQIPLADQSVDFMTLHCTYEHFEGQADTGFVRECARLLKPNGRVVIVPLYLNPNYVNITGEVDQPGRAQVIFDDEASYHCVIPEWKNRFGRHYSPEFLLRRVLIPCRDLGLQPLCYRVRNWTAVHPDLWMRWILVIRQPRLIRIRAFFRRILQTLGSGRQTRPRVKARNE